MQKSVLFKKCLKLPKYDQLTEVAILVRHYHVYPARLLKNLNIMHAFNGNVETRQVKI